MDIDESRFNLKVGSVTDGVVVFWFVRRMVRGECFIYTREIQLKMRGHHSGD